MLWRKYELMTKTKLTVTIDDTAAKYVTALAKAQFEGNESMAIRKIIAEHSRKINYTNED